MVFPNLINQQAVHVSVNSRQCPPHEKKNQNRYNAYRNIWQIKLKRSIQQIKALLKRRSIRMMKCIFSIDAYICTIERGTGFTGLITSMPPRRIALTMPHCDGSRSADRLGIIRCEPSKNTRLVAICSFLYLISGCIHKGILSTFSGAPFFILVRIHSPSLASACCCCIWKRLP